MVRKFTLVLLLIITGISSASAQNIHIAVSDSLIKLGDVVSVNVNGWYDRTQQVRYYEMGSLAAITDSLPDTTGYAVWMPKKPGYQKICAVVGIWGGVTTTSDTVGVYVAQIQQMNSLLLNNVTYVYVTKIFPDTAIVLPQNTIVLAKSYSSTTHKILLNMLYPRF